MYVEASGRIFVETFHEDYEKIKPFLISCCEPVCRTSHVNEYIILPSSLAAAASEGVFNEDDIRAFLRRYGKASSHDGFLASARTGSEQQGISHSEGDDEEEFVIPPVVEEMLEASSSANRLRILLERSHRHSKAAGEGGDDGGGSLTFYLASNNRYFIEKVVNYSRQIRSYLEPIGPAATAFNASATAAMVQASGGAVQAEAGDSASIDGYRWIFSDTETYEIPLTDGEMLLRKQALAMKARLEGENPQAVALAVEDGPKAGRSTMTANRLVYKAEIAKGSLRALRQEIQERQGIHIDCSYDHSTDTFTDEVKNFRLKPTTKLRFYQEQSLERFQSKGRVRNGIIVLPCGAGKSLTGIAAASIIGKPTIVMCINVQSVLQWREQFLTWTTLKPEQISICTSGEKRRPADIFITTYSMLTVDHKSGMGRKKKSDTSAALLGAAGGQPAEEKPRKQESIDNEKLKKEIFADIENKSWGLLILDEVHTAPADSFQRVIDKVTAHCVLGLTATLLREDGRIDDLRFLVGPKLFEANWLELAKAGHLATVHCAEIRCNTPVSFLRRYAASEEQVQGKRGERTDIEAMNPIKFWCCQALIQFHTETRSPSDKIIVFCDSRVAIRYYALKLGVPFMDGATKEEERTILLEHFRKNPAVNVLLISKVGDTALDLPEANVIVQINGMFASRRQEAQRLGRILRPKPPSMDSSSAFFYTLVSTDTDEERFTFPRQQWLREQGFAYRVLGCNEILNFYRNNRGPTLPPRPLLCVGPSQWCVKVTRESFAALKHYQYLPDGAGGKEEESTSLKQEHSTSAGGGGSTDHHHHHHHTRYPPYVGHWLSLDTAAAELLERAFTRGRSATSIQPPTGATRPPTPIPSGAASTKNGKGIPGLAVVFSQGQGFPGTHGTLVLPMPLAALPSHLTHGYFQGEVENEDEEPSMNINCYIRRGAGDIPLSALAGVVGGTFKPEQHTCEEYCMEHALNTFRPTSSQAQAVAKAIVPSADSGRGRGRGRGARTTAPGQQSTTLSSFAGSNVARPEAKRSRS